MILNKLCTCILSKGNLLHNLAFIKTKVPHAKIMAMVKDNAYGHGIIPVSQILEDHIDALGVVSIEEAMMLRKKGIKKPIVLMEGVFTPDELLISSEQKFSIIFHSLHQINWLMQTKLPNKLHAWLKLYTGMEMGFSPETAIQAMKVLSTNSSIIQPVGIMSHFACANIPTHPLNTEQIRQFQSFIQDYPGEKSLCNSAAILAFPDMHYHWVRPGLALYGVSPLSGVTASSIGLKPVMNFQSEILAIHHLKEGDNVSYNSIFTCPEDMLVGFAAVGYSQGYPQRSIRRREVLVNGVHCPLIGEVTMDWIAIDLRPCADAKVGSEVILWGEGLPVEEVAVCSDHISYDLMTNVRNVKHEWNAVNDDPF
jgi:alanine racemase